MPHSDQPERIAIVGVGGIFPGAPDLDTFWRNVAGGVDCGRHVPDGRWYLSPEKAYAPWPPQPDRVYSTWGCFIEGFQLDPAGLDLDPDLLNRLDPMFHLGLHAARAAFRDAKELGGVDHSRVGVILGNIALPTESTSAICRDVLGRTFVEKLVDAAENSRNDSVRRGRETRAEPRSPFSPAPQPSTTLNLQPSPWHPLNRYAAGLPSSLIAQAFGFGGIAFTLDAACASSLYALKFASEELLAHRADAMLAGGMSRPDCQYTQMGFAQLQALSKSGRCAPLSGEADGLVVGEGAGVFVLKRLSDAVAAGDHIYGVIAGIGLSNDRGANLLAPHSEGQLRAMRSAYEQAGWQPSDVDLIECHATGTPVGDAVEIESLHQLWQHETARPQQCVIGGVKSNVGHLLTGAGAAGLMKVLFALKHRTLPPTANYRQPAARLAANDSPFRVLAEAEPWTERVEGRALRVEGPYESGSSIPRRATINAFGFGGINAHVLIEEWPELRVEGRESRARRDDINQSVRPLVPSPPSSGERVRGPNGEDDFDSRLDTERRTPHPNLLPTTEAAVPEARGEGTGNESIAIIGLDSHVCTWDSKQSIQENDFQGKPLDWTELNWWGVEQSDWFRREGGSDDTGFIPNQPAKPFGHGIMEVRMPMGQFRIPPLEMQDMLPQQQLMLKVAAGALADAERSKVEGRGLMVRQEKVSSTALPLNPQPSTLDPSRTGVFVGIELDPNTTNFHLRWSIEQDAPRWAEMLGLDLTPDELSEWIKQLKDAAGPPLTPNRVMGNLGGIVASRLAREFDVGGPSFTISCGGDSGRTAFDLAVGMLRRGELDRAIVGAVDLPCDVRLMASAGDTSLPDGAIAFVLQRAADAVQDGRVTRVETGLHRRLMSARVSPIREPLAPFQFLPATHSLLGALPTVLKLVEARQTRKALLEPRRLAFIFPGSGNAFIGMGRELLAAFPEVLHRQATENHRLRGQYRPDLIWGGTSTAALLEDHKTMIFSQVAMGTAICDLLALFGVRPSASIGYSLGESAALFGLRAWTDRDEMLDRMEQASLFGSDLVAPFNAARKAWGAPEGEDVPWLSGVIDRSADEVRAAISQMAALVPSPPSSGERARVRGSSGECGLDSVRRGSPDPAEVASEGLPLQLLSGSKEETCGRAFRRGQETRAEQKEEPLTLTLSPHSRGEETGATPRVYLLIVNTPRQCVIGGDRSQVEQLVRDLNATFVPLAAPSTVHCEVLRQVEAAYRELHLMRTVKVEGRGARVEGQKSLANTSDSQPSTLSSQPAPIDFYSTAWGCKYDLTRESAAEAIVAQAVGTIDFPRVIEQAYADGVRVFVEIGPGSSCTKMIDEILGDRPHLAQAALPNTSRPVETFLELLAALIAERVPVDLSYLYGESKVEGRGLKDRLNATQVPVREIVTRVGGLPFEIPSPPNGWKFRQPAVELVSFNRVGIAPREAAFQTQSRGAMPTRLNDEPLPESRAVVATALTINLQPSSLNHSPFELLQLMTDHRSQAHETFLRFADRAERLAAEHLAALAQAGVTAREEVLPMTILVPSPPFAGERARVRGPNGEDAFNREAVSFDDQLSTIHHQLAIESPPHSNPLPPKAGCEGTRAAAPRAEMPTTAIPTLPLALDPRSSTLNALRSSPPRSLDREECRTFAIGRIGDVLGTMFSEIDRHPTRVRLPDEPLMLVDRILTIEGEPLSMTSGRVVTEHDIHPGAWYLDCDRIPTCIAVESGQADLFLSGWLGIDFETKGIASYRLLDAVVTFHDELPQAGKTINYDIRVLHFFRQGSTYLFRFEFDATVDGRPLLTMREGCAGFFTQEELAGGKGIIHTALDKRPRPGKRPADWSDPVPMTVESYDDSQLLALRRGDLATCFGPAFAELPLRDPVTIPGLMRSSDSVRRGSPGPAETLDRKSPLPSHTRIEAGDLRSGTRRGQETRAEHRSRMWLIDRVLKLDPVGGKFGMGTILGELDIHPDDWFLTCHFYDDQVMPGTLMYECCMHTLRIFLLRMGWVGSAGQIAYQPIPEVRSRLKCRGQVLSSTQKVWYEVTLKEVGYGPDAYCLADALMYADGKPIVEITDMSVKLTGLSREMVMSLWSSSFVRRESPDPAKSPTTGLRFESSRGSEEETCGRAFWLGQETHAEQEPLTLALSPQSRGEGTTAAAPRAVEHRRPLLSLNPQPSTINPTYDFRPAIFDTDRITAFAIGKPSDAFGDKYRAFDEERKIARLPGPPFQFLDRVVSIENCQPWKLEAGGEIVAQYDIPVEAWYFAANRQPTMPFAVLLETALQPCGWLAGYLGSALTSETDLSFRNLGGKAIQYREVTPQSGTLTTKVKITKVSQSGGMIIQNFDYHLSCNGQPVYVGDTYFGFFSKASLVNQVGIRDAKVFVPSPDESSRASRFDSPDAAPFSNSEYMMVDSAELLLDGGPHGLGFVRGTMTVDPSTWFFKAHFYEDPVVPGSLGLESFFQLMKFYAAARWRLGANAVFQTPSLRLDPATSKPVPHEWVYRGQIVPRDALVTVTAIVRSVDDATRQLTAEGFLSVDGRVIYQMKSFTLSAR